jgi:hypothetical protein
MVEPDRPWMIIYVIRRMCFTFKINKATDKQSEYVILIASLQPENVL